MKKVVLFILLILTSLGIWSQGLNALVIEGKQWNVYSNLLDGTNGKTTITLLRGDTLIHDLVYKKVYSAQKEDISDLKCERYCIREDNKKSIFIIIMRERKCCGLTLD